MYTGINKVYRFLISLIGVYSLIHVIDTRMECMIIKVFIGKKTIITYQ